MAAYAALVSLLNNIHAVTKHPQLSTSFHNNQIQSLVEKTNFLLEFVEGNNYGAGSKEAQDLERQITSAAHAAEDLIESHIVDQIHAAKALAEYHTVDQIHAGRSWSYLPMLLLKCVGCDRFEKSPDLNHSIHDMDAIMKKVAANKNKTRSDAEEQPALPTWSVTNSEESGMVGLDAELNKLLDELTGYQSSRRIISIAGMGVWQINAKEVLSKLLSGLGLGELSNAEVDALGLQLHKTLFGRRYLIILDDIWSVTAWDEVKRFFPDNNNASRVLLTTRLSNVARDCGSSIVTINLLDGENSWKLFCREVFQNDDCPYELREVGEKIVKLCKGLALSIVVIGGLLLNSPRDLGHWEGILRNLASIPNSKEKQESLDVLTLSYNHLPSHLKPCFLYLGVFKEDSQIRVSNIIKLWVAEGFIKPIGSQVLEEIAEDLIKDLIDRNLIIRGKIRKNEKVGFFGIHDLLRDMCIKFAEQEGFLQVTEGIIPSTQRRVVDNWYIYRTELTPTFTRSFITFRLIVETTAFGLLRVLDENGNNSKLDFYGNVNLRYLSYRHPIYGRSSWEFPTSISLMWNLQTIIIKGAYCLIVASTGFWKLRQLRHVECRQIYLPSPPPSTGKDELPILENLQTLKGTLNLRMCKEVCKIIPNIKTLHLAYDDDFQGYDDSWMECLLNLDRLCKLESLNISSSVCKLVDKCLTALPNSLKKLCLSKFRFQWDDLTMIGSLPQLEVLELETSACEGKQWSPVDGQFRRLKFLKIQGCDLSRWDADESNFPVLKRLILEHLPYLEEIPLCIGDIPTLELIRVDCCSNSAAVSAVKIKEDQLEQNDNLQVQVSMWEKEVESFNQMLEAEGLTVDNIMMY